MQNEKILIEMWWEGRYALGWRGFLAKKLLRSVVSEEAAQQVFFAYTTTPKDPLP